VSNKDVDARHKAGHEAYLLTPSAH
jgi:hypothetical protein